MVNKEYNIADFSPHLFWDVDGDNLDWEKNKSQIVMRVIEYGLMNDWKIIYQKYGLKQIGKICKDLRSLDDRSHIFISILSGIPKKSFRCYILKQSIPKHWNF